MFRFSGPVADLQNFAERLKIQNVQATNFSIAIGTFVIVAEVVTFEPRLPNKRDRSDAGFRENADYVVFLKAGPDALVSSSGGRITSQQEFTFRTSSFYEDAIPDQPPRVLSVMARDPLSDVTFDISRLDPVPAGLAALDNADLIDGDVVIEPGAGADFGVPWQFEVLVSEPIDPATVLTTRIELFEIFSDATTSGVTAPPAAPPDSFGTPVEFKVPVNVTVDQGLGSNGQHRIVVTPVFTLVDNTRYRLHVGGTVLGLDFRQTFIGENGMTGDGLLVPEPGGLGYVTEFIARDRPAVQQTRTLTYDPLVDGIHPELGQTVADETRFNSSLYNPAPFPSNAVGFLSAFGQGTGGDLAVTGGSTLTIDTGDIQNDPLDPVTVFDLNPSDDYLNNPLPGGNLTYTNPEPFEMQLASMTVSSSSTLTVIGVNPIVFRVTGIVQIDGRIDVAGGDGQQGGGASATGGLGGPAGFAGASTTQGPNSCRRTGSCIDFGAFLNSCGAAKAGFPHTLNGAGPGRGYAGGETYVYDYVNDLPTHGGSGGGGGSHGETGTRGEDRRNTGATAGTVGPSCSRIGGVRNAGVVGVRGESGPTYGDREIADVLLGGSSGGGGGSLAVWGGPKNQAGGSGGGGGGSIAIIAAGPILATGGSIDASGGNGGRGRIAIQNAGLNWQASSGGGGGGAGGSITLISGATITLINTVIDASGGLGGVRADVGTSQVGCAACNAGGAGGRGYIFLMDADGVIDGFLPAAPGEYDGFATGILTISEFETSRFSSVAAVTELFQARAANPTYLPFLADGILAVANADQRINVFASSAKADPDDPLVPDLGSEITPVQVALIHNVSGAVVVTLIGDLSFLNPGGGRDAFLRIEARFEYDRGVEAALGPFATIDRVNVNFTFNG